MRKKPLAVVALLGSCCLALWGCYTTRPNLPAHATSIAVPMFENRSYFDDYVRGLETEVTKSVRKAFLQNGRLKVEGREHAALILEGEVLNLTRKPLRVDRYGEPAETQIKVSAKISLYDVKESRYLFRRVVLTNEATKPESGVYNLRRGEAESLGRERAIEDLGRAIARRVLDRW
jgi:hypothetical protein